MLWVALVVALLGSVFSLLPQGSKTAPAAQPEETVPQVSTEIPLPKVDTVPHDTASLPKVDTVPDDTAPLPKVEKPAEQPEKSYSYVLNTNTMRIHKPTCSSVNEMNPKNRQYTEESIEELEAEGYVKCKRCF